MLAQLQSSWTPKLLWFIFPSLIGSGVWWYVVSRTLAGQLSFDTAGLPALLTFIVFGFFSFGLWLGSIGLIGYLGKSRLIRFVSAAVVALPLLAFFSLTTLSISLSLATWLVIWWSIERFTHDANSRLQIKPQYSYSWSLPTVVFLLMIVVSMLYYQQIRGSSRTADELSERLSGQTISIIERFLPVAYKEYDPDMTVDDLIGLQIPSAKDLLKDINFDQLNQVELEQQLRESLSKIEGYPVEEFQLDPATSRAELEAALDLELAQSRRQLSENIRTSLSDQFQVQISGNARLHDVLTEIVNKQFERYVSQYVTVLPWLLALALLFILRVFSGVFVATSAMIGWLLLWLYRHLHILHISNETVPAERIEWGK